MPESACLMLRWNKRVVGCLVLGIAAAFFTAYKFSNRPVASLAALQTDAITSVLVQSEKTVSRAHISTMVDKQIELGDVAKNFYATLPDSLADVPEPAQLRVDDKGNLVVEKRILRLFDYYMTATGEEPLENIVARIKQSIESQLSPLAAAQALVLLEGYLQYRNNVGVIKNAYGQQQKGSEADLDRMKEMKLAVRDSRSEFLPQEAIEIFYAEEDDYDDYMMNRAQIQSNSALSAKEKLAEIALLDLSTPSQVLESRQKARQISDVRSGVEKLREAGASRDEIYSLREQEFGAEAAGRLGALDSKRELWDARMADYRSELQAFDLGDDYPQAEKEEIIRSLRNQHFDPQEVLRVQALDKIQQGSAIDDSI